MCPHHPNCHCTLIPIDFPEVLANSSAHSDYRKFDPYLFNTDGNHPHGKDKLFRDWGYTIDDLHWLKSEIERQGHAKYLSGNYTLGKLDRSGQRISIRIELPRNNSPEFISFVTGWMVYPNGTIRLTTPYGGR